MTGERLRGSCKVVFVILALVVSLLFLIATIRTLSLDFNAGLHLAQWEKTNHIPADLSPHQRQQLLENFRESIRIPTVSWTPDDMNTTAMAEFGNFLLKAFPGVYASPLVKHEVVANYSHLLTVSGSDSSLTPYMLLAHIDVVPATESDGWDVPPFSGAEVDGFIYGRGTMDDKQSLMAVLQALEFLLERGYAPRRAFYIGLGHDEEVLGYNGAVNIVRLLQSRGVRLAYVLDEGMPILDGVIRGVADPVAIISVSEKGQATVKLSVSTSPGHSSVPPKESSIGILAAAVTRLENNPMPLMFGSGPERGMFEHLAHKFILPIKFAASNLWLFGPLLGRVLGANPTTNGFVRTNIAVTMFNSGVKLNVLAPYAEAFLHIRIHSAQTVNEVVDLVRQTVHDQRVKVELLDGFNPLPVSPYDEKSFGFQIVKKTVLDVFPQVTVAPGICLGNTDSRHYSNLSDSIYRFAPTWSKQGDPERFHGVNERLHVKNYEEFVVFFFQLIQNSDIKKLPETHGVGHEL